MSPGVEEDVTAPMSCEVLRLMYWPVDELIELGLVRSSVSSSSSTAVETPFEDRTDKGTACGDVKARSSSVMLLSSCDGDGPAEETVALRLCLRTCLPAFIVKSTVEESISNFQKNIGIIIYADVLK